MATTLPQLAGRLFIAAAQADDDDRFAAR